MCLLLFWLLLCYCCTLLAKNLYELWIVFFFVTFIPVMRFLWCLELTFLKFRCRLMSHRWWPKTNTCLPQWWADTSVASRENQVDETNTIPQTEKSHSNTPSHSTFNQWCVDAVNQNNNANQRHQNKKKSTIIDCATKKIEPKVQNLVQK